MTTNFTFARSCLAPIVLAIALVMVPAAFATAATAILPRLPSIPAPPFIPNEPQPLYAPSRPLNPYEAELVERARRVESQTTKLPEKQKETPEEFLEGLLNEFGPDARFGITDRFVFIYDTTDAYAQWCATVMENVASTYEKFVSNVKFVEDGLNDPMVVFIFADKADYLTYTQKHVSDLMPDDANKYVGFYFGGPNRAVFYDSTGKELNKVDKTEPRSVEKVATEVLADPKGPENLSTIVHEGTHQVSANYGMFSRRGENPKWAVEGLAMLFEAPDGEAKDGGWKVVDEKAKTIKFPINKRRLREFQQYAATTTDAQPVKKCVGLEKVTTDEPCAYPVSWILFYYLYRNHLNLLTQYLMDSAAVQPRLSYTSRARVEDFAYYFGDDWDGMYLELRAFADALQLELNGIDPDEAQRRTRAKYNLPEKPAAKGKKGAKKNAAAGGKKTSDDKKTAAEDKKTDVKGTSEPKTEKKPEPAKPSSAKDAASGKTPAKKSTDLDDWLDAWTKEKKN